MAGYYTQRRPQPIVAFTHPRRTSLGPGVVEQMSVDQTTFSYRSSQPKDAEDQTAAHLMKMNQQSPFASNDNGHEFNTRRMSVSFGSRTSKSTTEGAVLTTTPRYSTRYDDTILGSTMHNYEYHFYRRADLASVLYEPPMSQNDKIFYGKELLLSAVPTRPEASISTFAAEFLRDGLPSLMLSSIGTGRFQGIVNEARKASGDYLNVQFGWGPLVRDFSKVLQAVMQSYKIVSAYQRDSGRVVRRGRALPVQDTTVGYNPGFWFPNKGIFSPYSTSLEYDPLAFQYRNSPCNIQLSTSVKMWFNGAFTYYLPDKPGLFGRIEKYAALADKLIGVKITPAVLWNAAPWSWLLDWFADIGTTVELYTAFQDNDLVLQYGYLMKETRKRYLFDIRPGEVGKYPAPPLSSVITGVTKERFRASPFGFGLNPESLSLQQWLIAGAVATSNRRSITK